MERGLLKQIKENWVILFFIASLIVTWTRFEVSLGTLEERVVTLETRSEKSIEVQNQILVQLSQIQTDLSWIRSNLAKLQ